MKKVRFDVHDHESGVNESPYTMYKEPLLDKSRAFEDGGQWQKDNEIDFKSYIHQLNSFFAVVWPVSISIISSSLAVTLIADPAMKQAMMSYMYYQDIDSSNSSTTVKMEQALFNAFLIILFIAILTFGVVLLYKCDGMHLFAGYCMLYSTALLGLMGSKLVVIVLCKNLHLVVDVVSLTIFMYNFAVVGVLSIFYQKGIPSVLERSYLIVTSVIVAWQLAQLPEWSVWMLLLLLGFWDLFAVLTPVGPLRCLVDLIQKKGTPIPGLLFETNVVDSHLGENTNSRVETRRFATRDTMREKAFLDHLLQSEIVENDHSGVHDFVFQHKVQTFLYDQNSPCQHRSEELSNKFQHNQLHLWRSLYTYYEIDYVTKQQPYPSVQTVFDQFHASSDDSSQIHEDKSIKLGLGDFIFYSVLVARASMHGFQVFSACFLAILVGLCVTLYLLARFDALPALPISLFLGIIVYLLSIVITSPMLDNLQTSNIYDV